MDSIAQFSRYEFVHCMIRLLSVFFHSKRIWVASIYTSGDYFSKVLLDYSSMIYEHGQRGNDRNINFQFKNFQACGIMEGVAGI